MQFERLGPYRIGPRLGKGGMGAVYQAVHVETGQLAAVKAPSPQLAMAEGFRERFEAEIESLKKLRHPGIVRLYGYGEQDGFLFYAMELVEGTSLEEELAQGRRFGWREVADIGIQICRALKHAHDHGIVHRDIKPANLLFDTEGNIKIADFGIARLFGGTQLTTAGGVLGTADYMSPEQADGRHVTERCDQYSLGGVMYALLAGRPPFRAKNLPEMLQLQRFAKPESVRRYAPDTPLQLERLVMQLLSKDPADRFPNVMALARHMEAMVKALSRPTEDDFALQTQDTTTGPIEASGIEESISLQATRLEMELAEASAQPGTPAASSGDTSPTELDEAASGLTGPLTKRVYAEEGALEVEPPPPRAVPGGERPQAARQTHFTTVEDDALLVDTEDDTSWLATVSQGVVLLGVLGLLGYALWHFTRPATADQLYEAIAEAAQEGKLESLRNVEEELDEFVQRFAKDPRSAEVQRHRERIELWRTQRRLEADARGRVGGQPLLAIEHMFLEAQQIADSRPAQAATRMEAILTLYGEAGGADADTATTAAEPREEAFKRVDTCLRLTRRRLAELRQQIAAESERQLPELRQRLERAQAIAAADPDRARQMLEAFILLAAEKPWASEMIRAAHSQRNALDEPTTTPEQPAHAQPPEPSTTADAKPIP